MGRVTLADLPAQLQRMWLADSLQLSATSATSQCATWAHTPLRVWPVISGGDQNHISFDNPTNDQANGRNKGLAIFTQCRTPPQAHFSPESPQWSGRGIIHICIVTWLAPPAESSCPNVNSSEVDKHCSLCLFVAIKWSLSQKFSQNYLRYVIIKEKYANDH